MPGTWHLYRDDYKLSGVLNRPMTLAATGCYAACEANVTTYLQSARWEAIAAVGRKRHAARVWQERGIRVFVDLNVPLSRWPDVLMAGVPRGWRAFATRAYANDLDVLRGHCPNLNPGPGGVGTRRGYAPRMANDYFETLRATGDAWDAFRELARQDRSGWTDAERAELSARWHSFVERMAKLKTLQESRDG